MRVRTLKRVIMAIPLLMLTAVTLADPVWIDVRSSDEYAADSIPGDINIPHQEAVPEVSRLYPEKDTEIRLYCRSGRRSDLALQALQSAGYTQVSNAGGIADARAERNDSDD